MITMKDYTAYALDELKTAYMESSAKLHEVKYYLDAIQEELKDICVNQHCACSECPGRIACDAEEFLLTKMDMFTIQLREIRKETRKRQKN